MKKNEEFMHGYEEFVDFAEKMVPREDEFFKSCLDAKAPYLTVASDHATWGGAVISRLHLHLNDAHNEFLNEKAPVRAVYDSTGERIRSGTIQLYDSKYQQLDEFAKQELAPYAIDNVLVSL